MRVGDVVLSRPDDDAGGPVEGRRVLLVYARRGRVIHLHAGGRVIRTTAEHPFWVRGRGWVACAELRVGDVLAGHDGGRAAVEDLLDTGEEERVYNLLVEEYHTYFVGAPGWGFSLWAHNGCVLDGVKWLGGKLGAVAEGLGSFGSWAGAKVSALSEWVGSFFQSNNPNCFAAGTPLLTPDGSRSVEQFKPGDRLLSRPESDPQGALEVVEVDEVFANFARVVHLHVCGEVLRCTAEHPFWVRDKGWTPAHELRPGDELSGHDGRFVLVEEVYDTGEFEPVYNLRVAHFHTYFVGCAEWGFSVWAHNTSHPEIVRFREENNLPPIEPSTSRPNDSRYRGTVARLRLDGEEPQWGLSPEVGGRNNLQQYKLTDQQVQRAFVEWINQNYPRPDGKGPFRPS